MAKMDKDNLHSSVEVGDTVTGVATAVGNIFDIVGVTDQEVGVILAIFSDKLLNRMNSGTVEVEMEKVTIIIKAVERPAT